ncbi:hypothetical protein J2Z48_001412 [Croceifilum oryzae]|uniref:Uncharacterized protein n=1 Tax=Croceifilum oryzae TaxID=1553429 RepID=A0AAJ1TM66_9BACL|nr:hypothetical protein [Croceifilum oryzae]MDQ0417240.1 hypothetical protein [Croceifilum oryzae]
MKAKRFIAGLIACSGMFTGMGLTLPSSTYAATNTATASLSQDPKADEYTVISNAVTENYFLDSTNSKPLAFFTPKNPNGSEDPFPVRLRITTSHLDVGTRKASRWQMFREVTKEPKSVINLSPNYMVGNGETKEYIVVVRPGKLTYLNANKLTGIEGKITGTITIDYIKFKDEEPAAKK